MRDKEDRVRFSGYDVANFKVFVFCFAAALAGDRRRDVHAAGRLHVAVLRRHRALDRDGDLLRRGRAHVAARRGLRRAAGQLRARRTFPKLSAAVAVRDGRAVHRRGDAFPNGLAGVYRRYVDPLGRPACCPAPQAARQPDHRVASNARRTRSAADEPSGRPTDTDFLLAVEGLTVSFDGFKAVDDLTLYVDRNEIRVIIGPNGAGKTTRARPDLRPDQGHQRLDQVQGPELTKMREHEIVRAGVGRKFQTPSIYEDLTVFENLEISYPRGRSVFGALTFKRDAEVRERVEEIARDIFLSDQLDTTPRC